ncbi:MAG: hypothetical protein EHM35_00280 [Planctomycetaceae bacterium]|nr:MAG: hypothetical protein EHM35_00280 [Planctomycetaceae bacterium]
MTDSGLIPNSFQHPNVYIDRLSYYLTPAEEKVLNKAIREIYGWHNKIADRRSRIALSVFTDGKRNEAGDILCLGCGLSTQAVREALVTLDEFRVLLKIGKPNILGQMFEIQDNPDKIDWAGLAHRKQAADEQNAERTRAAIEAATVARAQKQQPEQAQGVTSDITSDLMSDIASGVTSDSNKETQLETQKETQVARVAPGAPAGGKKDSGGTRAKRKDPPHKAIGMFRDNASRYPPKSWYADIASTVGTDPARLEFWGRVVKKWVGLGWNPMNVEGMLDHYRRNELPGDGYRNGKQPPPAQSTVRGI